MIAVLRRVDNNWGEGVLHGEVGIFPLSFVKVRFSSDNKNIKNETTSSFKSC